MRLEKKLSPKQVVVMSGFEGKLDDYIKSINELGRRDSIPKWFKPFLDSFRKFAADVSHHITEMDNKVKSTEGSLAIQKAVTDSLAVDRDRLQTFTEKLEDQLDDQEQYSRRNCLLIHGVEEKPNENLENVVMDILDNKLQARGKSLLKKVYEIRDFGDFSKIFWIFWIFFGFLGFFRDFSDFSRIFRIFLRFLGFLGFLRFF